MTDLSTGFTIVRELDATPEEIWRAWTEPDEAAVWWHPQTLRTPRETVSIDAVVGGEYRYTMVNDETGETYPTGGVYREVVPYERLQFTWGTPGDVENSSLVTVTLEPFGELTKMTFDLRGFEGMRGDGSFYDGWDEALNNLVSFLGQNEIAG